MEYSFYFIIGIQKLSIGSIEGREFYLQTVGNFDNDVSINSAGNQHFPFIKESDMCIIGSMALGKFNQYSILGTNKIVLNNFILSFRLHYISQNKAAYFTGFKSF